jgi:SAM-dependent methyltransferase
VAEDYDRYRPGLPEEAVGWLLPPTCRVVLDLGAGTGSATRVLARRVEHVIAVEPDPRMRNLIHRKAPHAEVLQGRAEAIPLAAGSVDAVVVSSAFHWMDPDLAIPEIARVLRPGGVLGLLWNSMDREAPVVRELRRLTGHPRLEEDPGRTRRPEEVRLPEGAPFGPPEVRTIRWTWKTTRDGIIGLMRTYSSVIVLPAGERAEVDARVRDFVAALPGEDDGNVVALPMACRCWKALRI